MRLFLPFLFLSVTAFAQDYKAIRNLWLDSLRAATADILDQSAWRWRDDA